MGELDNLTAKRVEREKKPGRYLDGRGLYLEVREGKKGLSKSFVLRYMRDGVERWMGLGSVYDVTLKKARQKALEARGQLNEGIDPLQHKREQKAKRQAAAPNRGATFAQIAERYFAINEGGWRSATHRQQWRSSIVRFANPVIGDMPIADVDADAVQRVLEPVWLVTPTVAQRLRGRLELILDFAHALGLRASDNPAAARRVRNLLGARPNVRGERRGGCRRARFGIYVSDERTNG